MGLVGVGSDVLNSCCFLIFILLFLQLLNVAWYYLEPGLSELAFLSVYDV